MTNFKMYLIEWWYPKGNTDSDLARALGVEKTSVCRWVNGEREPSLERKIAIGRVLGVDSRLIFPEKGKGEKRHLSSRKSAFNSPVAMR